MFPLHLGEFFRLVTTSGATEAVLGLKNRELLLSVLLIGFMEWMHLLQRNRRMRTFFTQQPLIIRWAIYYGVIIALISFGEYRMQEFIYFQF